MRPFQPRATETQPMEAAPVVEQTPVPVTSLEATELSNQIDQKRKRLTSCIPYRSRIVREKDDANIGSFESRDRDTEQSRASSQESR